MNQEMKIQSLLRVNIFKIKWLCIVPFVLFVTNGLYAVNALSVDTTAPTGNFEVLSFYGEVSGATVGILVSTYDDESLVRDVCLWLGDGIENLIQPAICKTLAEKDWNSYDYAPSFTFSWDSTTIADGTYNLYVIATDNANNVGNLGPVAMTVNNSSLGSPSLPAPITTCQEFQNINNHGGWYYDIKNDINCAETKSWNGGQGFMPISSFGGVLNGHNFNINDIYMNITYLNASDNGGVFYSNGGTIENLNLRNVDISAVGYLGGMTNQNYGIISKSSVTGKITCGYQQCGAMAGVNSGTISECWTDVDIVGPNYVGAIAGHSWGGQIANSYAKGKVTANNNSGGAIGLNQSNLLNSYSVAEINSGSSNGGLIGWQYGGVQSGSYWDTETSGLDIMCGPSSSPLDCNEPNGLTDALMKEQASFVGWDFINTWRIDPNKNDGYPYLAWQTSFTEKNNFPWQMFLPTIIKNAHK
jgi:hypothetical protein